MLTTGFSLPIRATRRHGAVPAPGIIHGEYPQRRDSEPASWGQSLLPLLKGPGWKGRAISRNFVATVRQWEGRHGQAGCQAFGKRVRELRALLARDGLVDLLLAETLALVSLACRRELAMTPHDNQLVAAHIMLNRQLAEMATGEGKTLAAGIAAIAAALSGVPVHVVTANDYLAGRDAAMLRPLAAALGLSVGIVTQPMDFAARRASYGCDIVYCTAPELVFDYLRDNLAGRPQASGQAMPGRLLRGLCMAIIDEADSILIDEARVPLVLSQQTEQTELLAEYAHAWALAEPLEEGRHFLLQGAVRTVQLTSAGRALLRTATSLGAPWRAERRGEDLVCSALAARHLLQPGVHYHLRAGKVCLIDDATGRTAEGRVWSGGLQQMVEQKEGCKLSPPSETRTQITYQRFFPRYHWLCGMSGTLSESRQELAAVYGLAVRRVPLCRPSRRMLAPAQAFPDQQSQWQAVVAAASAMRRAGRPLLVGTDTVADSEALSRCLAEAGLAHAVMNARHDQHEAALVADAGIAGAITVATNMAGRGTDIALAAGVADKGGLHVICCQQNGSPRIDRQLIGRCARQGEPGSAQRYIALDGRLLLRQPLARVLRALRPDQRSRLWPAWRTACNCLAPRLLTRAQKKEQKRQRGERDRLLQTDRELARWLSFGGASQ
ncbi:DEAD/DEAH box helicase [Noviherbaspirillum sp. 1P10PC]|uniref:preprotein translocase subunit SecA n=1 Tax=Noviherbaspirillum sp. 1P10PC TaxID=3132292 RepID=UPI0039A3989A